MLIYGYVGKKALKTKDFWNNLQTNRALYCYNYNLTKANASYEKGNLLARHVYNSYTTLCKFNNSLVSTYEVNDSYIANIDFVKNYLEQNIDIENSVDSKCRNIYDHLRVWYKRLVNNSNSLDDIKWEVAKTMKYYEKQGIFTIASINLKRNYYDFVV